MTGKNLFATALLVLFFISFMSWIVYATTASSYLDFCLFALGLFGCFVGVFSFYAFGTKVTRKKLFFLATLLFSVWMGLYFVAVGIALYPSMGMVSVPFGIFLFVAIWALYAVIRWLIIPLFRRKTSGQQSKDEQKQ